VLKDAAAVNLVHRCIRKELQPLLEVCHDIHTFQVDPIDADPPRLLAIAAAHVHNDPLAACDHLIQIDAYHRFRHAALPFHLVFSGSIASFRTAVNLRPITFASYCST